MANETVVCTYRVRPDAWIEGGFGLAHEHPDVLMIWEAMDPLLEDRDGRPKWEFPHFAPVSVDT
jgi:hypothetical protein